MRCYWYPARVPVQSPSLLMVFLLNSYEDSIAKISETFFVLTDADLTEKQMVLVLVVLVHKQSQAWYLATLQP